MGPRLSLAGRDACMPLLHICNPHQNPGSVLRSQISLPLIICYTTQHTAVKSYYLDIGIDQKHVKGQVGFSALWNSWKSTFPAAIRPRDIPEWPLCSDSPLYIEASACDTVHRAVPVAVYVACVLFVCLLFFYYTIVYRGGSGY